MEDLLHEYVSLLLTEKAKSTKDARTSGIAMLFSFHEIVLYDSTKTMKMLLKLQKSFMGLDSYERRARINRLRPLSIPIVAMMRVDQPNAEKNWNAAEIQMAAAKEGFGPLIYDIAMSKFGGLTSDKVSVSRSAKKVWSYYKDNRLDVKAKPLDDQEAPRTKPKIDDAERLYGYDFDDEYEDWLNSGKKGDPPDYPSEIKDNPLNYAYFIKKNVATATLEKNHQNMIKLAKEVGFSEAEFENMIFEAASRYFNVRYID